MCFLDIQYHKHVHDVYCMCDVYKCKKITLLLGMVALYVRLQTSTLAGPMLRVRAPFLVFLPSPFLPPFPLVHPSPPHMQTFTTTEDCNMPKSSFVGHKVRDMIIRFYKKIPHAFNVELFFVFKKLAWLSSKFFEIIAVASLPAAAATVGAP